MTSHTPSSRVARRRAATLREIRQTARELLRASGPSGVTVNAVARVMGMSGPAVYRYYASHEQLVSAVVADFYAELSSAMRAARDEQPDDAHNRRLLAACRAIRAWAIEHPAEFTWMFTSSVPSGDSDEAASRQRAGQAFEEVFLEVIAQLWTVRPFPVPRLTDLGQSLSEQMRNYATRSGNRLPPEAMHVFLSSWIRLYGLLNMEVLGQLTFAYTDAEPLFEDCLRELCGVFQLRYEPPLGTSSAVSARVRPVSTPGTAPRCVGRKPQ